MKTIKKPCKVIMLPTDRASDGLYLVKSLCISGGYVLKTLDTFLTKEYMDKSGYKPQHLYFISGDEVKKGDYGLLGGIIHRFTHNIGKPDKGKYLKIIATTDESLTHPKTIQYDNMLMVDVNGDGSYYVYKGETELSLSREELINRGLLLHSIPLQFQEEYVKAGGIDEVMVDYELVGKTGEKVFYIPKVNSHNEITIHPIKDSWNREEVKALIKKYEEDTEYYGRDRYYRNVDIPGDWIKENL